MAVIHKYKLQIALGQTIELDKFDRAIHADFQGPDLCLWVIKCENATDPRKRKFSAVMTGQEHDMLHGRYIASCQTAVWDSPFVVHVFEDYTS